MQPSASATLKMYSYSSSDMFVTELLPGVDRHAGVVVHLAQAPERVHRHRRAPLLQLARGFLLLGLLFRRELASSAAAAPSSARRRRAGLTVPGHRGRRLFAELKLRATRRAGTALGLDRGAEAPRYGGACHEVVRRPRPPAWPPRPSPARPPPPPRRRRRRARKRLDRPAHQLDRADAGVDDGTSSVASAL